MNDVEVFTNPTLLAWLEGRGAADQARARVLRLVASLSDAEVQWIDHAGWASAEEPAEFNHDSLAKWLDAKDAVDEARCRVFRTVSRLSDEEVLLIGSSGRTDPVYLQMDGRSLTVTRSIGFDERYPNAQFIRVEGLL
jgi:hypothetical protein